MTLTRDTADRLLAALIETDAAEARIGEALKRWIACPADFVAADAVAIFHHELDRLPSDRFRVLADAARSAA